METLDTTLQKKVKQLMAQTSTTGFTEDSKKYKCNKCKDTEYVMEEGSDGIIYAVECECKVLRNYERSLKKAGLTEKSDKTFKSYEPVDENSEKLKNDCLMYVKNNEYKNKSLLLSGNVGSGKTHLALAIANNILYKGANVFYMEYRAFMTELKQNMVDKEIYQSEMNKVKKCDVLLIDDLYKGKITESDINIIYEIINNRYLENKPVIITSEKTIGEIIEIDEAIGSRIAEMSGDYILRASDVNYRLLKLEKLK